MKIYKVIARDQRDINVALTKLLKRSNLFYKTYDRVVFFPHDLQLGGISILPRVPQ
jgi:hypothetical protein